MIENNQNRVDWVLSVKINILNSFFVVCLQLSRIYQKYIDCAV